MSARPTAVHPILPVADVAKACAHYEALGFRAQNWDDGADYAFVARGDVELHLTHRPTSYYPADGIAVIYLDVDDADALYAEWADQPGETQHPHDMPWGMHEGVHIDPDGNVIRFGHPIG